MGFVFDIITELSTASQLIITALQFELLRYLIAGGWVTILRSIGFFIDKYLVVFITKGFEYFQLIIGRTLIVPATVESITRNVYFFIAAILFFKLAVRIMKYIIDPNLTGDDNIGVNSLVKRVIIGMILILFMPTIFSILRDFQSAIISDQVIEKTIMDRATYNEYNEITKRAPVGRIIGFSVLQGFLNFNDNLGGTILSVGSGNQEKQWKNAQATFDPSAIKDINAGGFLASDTYLFDYIPILSTIALGYTLYLIIKYCFDVLVRSFNLTILQVISPIVIVDYIMDGDREGSFKNWLKTTAGVFLMLFIRIVSLWFIIFVAIQMQMTNSDCVENLVAQGVETSVANSQCESSILPSDAGGGVDMLLRAGIIIALLAVSMDMPKLIGKIFNIDLEQESSVTGMIGKIGGIGKMVGLAGVSFAGGMLGGAIGGIKGGIQAGSNLYAGKKVNNAKLNNLTSKYNKDLAGLDKRDPNYATKKADLDKKFADDQNKIAADNRKLYNTAARQASAATRGMAFGGIGAALGRTSIGSSFTGAYSNSSGSVQRSIQNSASNGIIGRADEEVDKYTKQQQQEEAEKTFKQQQVDWQQQQSDQLNFQATVDLATRLKASGVPSYNLPNAIVDAQINANPAVQPQINNLEGAITAVAGGSAGIPDVTTAINTVVQSLQNSGMSNANIQTVVQQVQDIYNPPASPFGPTPPPRTLSSADAQKLVENAYRKELAPNADRASKLVDV